MKYKWIFIIPFLFSSFSGNAQNKVEKIYHNKGYSQYVEKRSKQELTDLPRGTLIKMANSYRKIGDTQNAEFLYGILLEEQKEKDLHLYYAQSLQANGKYAAARDQYLLYDQTVLGEGGEKPDNRGRVMAQACERVNQFRASGDIKITNEKALNGPNLDFSPTFFEEGIVFVSTRATTQSSNRTDQWLGDNFMDLFYAQRGGDGRLGSVKSFSDRINTKFHEGPVSFTEDEQKIYFTRNNYFRGKRGKSKDKTTKLKIYSARKVENKWSDFRELLFNSDELDVCHPTVSPDGRILVFSRSGEEGLGGMDLYVSYQVGNRWSRPLNLGPEINTAGNEAFPFLHSDGTLFFASDGLGGIGGMDIFMVPKLGPAPEDMWGTPLNIGAPLNSRYDDFGLILNREQTEGYFTSNREGGEGDDDIYHLAMKKGFDAIKPHPATPLSVCVYDQTTGERIEGARVTIQKSGLPMVSASAEGGTTVVLNLTPVREGSDEYLIKMGGLDKPQKNAAQTYLTNEEGYFEYVVSVEEKYIAEAIKDGYLFSQKEIFIPYGSDIEEFCIPLQPQIFANNNGINENSSLNKPSAITDPNHPSYNPNLDPTNPKSPIYDPNYNTENPTNPDNNPNGPIIQGIALNKDYNRPLPGTKINLFNRCTGEETTIEVGKSGSYNFPLECGCDFVLKAQKNNFIGDSRVINLSDSADCDKPIIMDMVMVPGFDKLGNPIRLGGNTLNKSLKEGDLIELKNIFYDFDEHYIRPEAQKDLDDLAALMLQFPSMEIELSSHTDSRGTKDYNDRLSSRRAKAAKEYLGKKGIADYRIIAVGYGERRTKNDCADGVDCSEYEHQRNRRTEVFITKFDKAEYLKVYYQNNEPVVVDPK